MPPRSRKPHGASKVHDSDAHDEVDVHFKKKKSKVSLQQSRISMLLFSGVVLLVVAVVVYNWYSSVIRDIVRTPLQAAKITESSLINQQDMSRFWGTYRSGLYFGMKARTPHSPVVG